MSRPSLLLAFLVACAPKPPAAPRSDPRVAELEKQLADTKGELDKVTAQQEPREEPAHRDRVVPTREDLT